MAVIDRRRQQIRHHQPVPFLHVVEVRLTAIERCTDPAGSRGDKRLLIPIAERTLLEDESVVFPEPTAPSLFDWPFEVPLRLLSKQVLVVVVAAWPFG